jgi:electron transport complex protein RnfE
MDAIGMGLGFTVALTLAGLLREVLGNGTAFGLQIFPESWEPVAIFVQPPGAFLVIAFFIIIMNAIGIKTRQRELVESNGCDGCCATCAMRCEDAKEETK